MKQFKLVCLLTFASSLSFAADPVPPGPVPMATAKLDSRVYLRAFYTGDYFFKLSSLKHIPFDDNEKEDMSSKNCPEMNGWTVDEAEQVKQPKKGDDAKIINPYYIGNLPTAHAPNPSSASSSNKKFEVQIDAYSYYGNTDKDAPKNDCSDGGEYEETFDLYKSDNLEQPVLTNAVTIGVIRRALSSKGGQAACLIYQDKNTKAQGSVNDRLDKDYHIKSSSQTIPVLISFGGNNKEKMICVTDFNIDPKFLKINVFDMKNYQCDQVKNKPTDKVQTAVNCVLSSSSTEDIQLNDKIIQPIQVQASRMGYIGYDQKPDAQNPNDKFKSEVSIQYQNLQFDNLVVNHTYIAYSRKDNPSQIFLSMPNAIQIKNRTDMACKEQVDTVTNVSKAVDCHPSEDAPFPVSFKSLDKNQESTQILFNQTQWVALDSFDEDYNRGAVTASVFGIKKTYKDIVLPQNNYYIVQRSGEGASNGYDFFLTQTNPDMAEETSPEN